MRRTLIIGIAVLCVGLYSVFFFSPSPVSPPPTFGDVTSNLVAHWKLDDGSGGTALDDTANNNDGSLVGSPSWTTGQVAGGLSLNGSSQYVGAGNGASLQISGALTVCAWMNPDTIVGGADTDIIAIHYSPAGLSRYYMSLANDNELQLTWSDDAGGVEFWNTDVDAIATGVWQHVCGVRVTADNVALYVDGVARSIVNTGSVAVSTASGKVDIGAVGDFGIYHFDGTLDDVRIYNRALSAGDIDELYDLGTAPPPAAPVQKQDVFWF